MSKSLTTQNKMAALEQVLIQGDLSPMSEGQRLDYVKAICRAVGISILFRPFDYIKFQGKTTLYANRSCTEQLRKRHKISIAITGRERVDGLYIVTAKAKMGTKEDESIGAINIKGLTGEALANAMMKAETKAKRRVTLSISGLGMLDEVEARDLAEQEAKITAQAEADVTETKLSETSERPAFEKEASQVSSDAETPAATTETEYKLRSVQGAIGKPLKQVSISKLSKFLANFNEFVATGNSPHPKVAEDAEQIQKFLNEANHG